MAETRNGYYGRVYNFPIRIGDRSKHQGLPMGGWWGQMVEWDASSTRRITWKTMVTTKVSFTNRLLERVNKNLKWSSMKFKPSKPRSISLCSGKLSDRKFVIDDI